MADSVNLRLHRENWFFIGFPFVAPYANRLGGFSLVQRVHQFFQRLNLAVVVQPQLLAHLDLVKLEIDPTLQYLFTGFRLFLTQSGEHV